jgi:hypothetical protein
MLGELVPADRAEGLLLFASGADAVVPLASGDIDALLDITRTTLRAAGLAGGDRVVIALNDDGEQSGSLLARACVGVVAGTASCGPRGRMRLLRAIELLRPTVLVMTPTGAQDFLSRLHIEFLVDPEDLGLERLLVVGEISSVGAISHLAAEMAVQVTELYADPVFGAVLGQRDSSSSSFTLADPATVTLAPLTDDKRARTLDPGERYELVVEPTWSTILGSRGIRTGQVAAGDVPNLAPGYLPRWDATIGDHVLVRGRWLSLPLIDRALRRIDGVVGWQLEIARPGTLDSATLHVALGRSTLENSGMWRSRITEAVAVLSPVHIDIATTGAQNWDVDSNVLDHRGHHLSADRAYAVASG